MLSRDIEKLEQLTELNVSSNNLTYLPSALGRHAKLQVLRANCNLLKELPNFKNSSALKVSIIFLVFVISFLLMHILTAMILLWYGIFFPHPIITLTVCSFRESFLIIIIFHQIVNIFFEMIMCRSTNLSQNTKSSQSLVL